MQPTRSLARALTATVGTMSSAIGAMRRVPHRPTAVLPPARDVDHRRVAGTAEGIVAHTVPGTTHIRLSGEIDAARLGEALGALAALDAAEPGAPVVLDARDVTFMDSTGVAFIETVHRTCAATGTPVHLLDPPASVTDVLALVGLEQAVPTVRTARSRPSRRPHRGHRSSCTSGPRA